MFGWFKKRQEKKGREEARERELQMLRAENARRIQRVSVYYRKNPAYVHPVQVGGGGGALVFHAFEGND